MGLFQAVSGAIGGTLADQWLDFYTRARRAARHGRGLPRGAQGRERRARRQRRRVRRRHHDGSKIVVPEGYGLVLIEDGAFTGFAAQPGGYVWDSEESASQSVFSGGGLVDSLIKQSWERFKFGGRPGSQQTAIFVALKELPNNKFGTQSEIYWDDAFLNTQVGAITRGTYTLKITDPLTFIRNFVSAERHQWQGRLRLHRHRQPRGRAALQRGRRIARTGLLDVHQRSRQGEPDRAAPAGLRRLRAVAVRRGGGELPVAHRPRSGDRQDRDHLDRVRRDHPRAAQERPARRRPVGLARQLEPPGVGRRGHRVGRRERRTRRADRDGHGHRWHGPRRAAAADPAGRSGRPGGARGSGGSGRAGRTRAPRTRSRCSSARRRCSTPASSRRRTTTPRRPRHWVSEMAQDSPGDGPPPRDPDAPVFDGPPLSLEEELAAARAEPEPGPSIETVNESLADGVNRCPKCGSTDVRQRASTGMLVCLFCRHEWQESRVEEEFGLGVGIDELQGVVIAGGAEEISSDDDVITMTCGGCGADVVVDTAHAMNARCHWCRHTLNVNQQTPNGAVPDAVLPFRLTHAEAVEKIREFASKRRLFAHPRFKKEFIPENVLGVYLPYLVIDARAEAAYAGDGRGADAALDREERRQLDDLLRRRRLPPRSLGRLHRRRPDGRGRRGPRPDGRLHHQQHREHRAAVRHQERREVELQLSRRLHQREA